MASLSALPMLRQGLIVRLYFALPSVHKLQYSLELWIVMLVLKLYDGYCQDSCCSFGLPGSSFRVHLMSSGFQVSEHRVESLLSASL